MDLADLPNPYEFANPVTNPERFAGRRGELSEIQYYLRHARYVEQPVNLALVGERAAGKTSLLNIIEHNARQLGLLTARINLNSADAEPIRLFWKLYEAVVDTVTDAGYMFQPGSDEDRTYRAIIDGLDVGADHPAFPLRFPAHYAASVNGGRQISETKLIRDLTTLYRASKTPCVLLFDECNVLAQNRITLEMLRNVFMSTHGYLVVLTGTPAMFPLFDEVFSPIIRQFKKIRVEPFQEQADTRVCIRGPLEALGLDVSELMPDARTVDEDVHQLSGGRPYEIQLLCHFMFRRVQEKRTDVMALTANVIDDVLRELELSATQPGASRPVIAAVRGLNQREFASLGVLAPCSGDATLDELWFAHQLMASKSGISRQDLVNHLNTLVDRHIVILDEQGRIRFAGDEFERVYISYLAESRDLAIRVGDVPYSTYLEVVFSDALREVAGSWPLVTFDSRPWVEESLRTLLSEDVKEIPADVRPLHRWILRATSEGKLTVTRASLSYGHHRALCWIEIDALLSQEEFDSGVSVMASRISALGGVLSVEDLAFDVPSEEEYLERVIAHADRDTLGKLGSGHATAASTAYFQGNSGRVWREIGLAERFPLDPDDLNNIGYMHLAAGRTEESAEYFERCLNADRVPDSMAALAFYNRAISLLARGKGDGILDDLERAAARLEALPGKRYEAACLFVPELADGQLVLVELADLELSEAVAQARETITSVGISAEPANLRPATWPIRPNATD